MTPAEQRKALSAGFKIIDKDHSGFIELAEAPVAISTTQRDGKIVDRESSSALWINGYDRNHDGKVSESEYVDITLERLARTEATGSNCVNSDCKRAAQGLRPTP